MEFNCPMCAKHYQAGDEMAGKIVNCKACQQQFRVPGNPSSASPLASDGIFETDSPAAPGMNSTADGDDRFSVGEVEMSTAPVTMRGGQSSDGVNRTSDEIDYEVFGHETQYVEITLDPGEQTIAEAGALMYMTDGVEMATVFGDPSQQDSSLFGKVLSAGKRVLTGEALFMTTFTNNGHGQAKVAFGAPHPGRMVPLHLDQLGGEIICQKDAFLCGARGITVDIAFQKKIGAGLFGGEGFIMQRLKGDGIVVIHAGGTMMYRELDHGETLRLDTGCLMAMGPTIRYDVEFVRGLKNAFFGGEGLFMATVRGPGPVWLQSLPFSRFAGRLAAAIPSAGNTRKGEGSVLGGLGEMFMGD